MFKYQKLMGVAMDLDHGVVRLPICFWGCLRAFWAPLRWLKRIRRSLWTYWRRGWLLPCNPWWPPLGFLKPKKNNQIQKLSNQRWVDLLIPLLGFDHGGFGAWWATWIRENDGQHSICPLYVLWNSDQWWWLWFPSSPFTAISHHQGNVLDLSLYLFFSWTHPLGASFFDSWWCGGFGLFNGSKYVWVVVEIWL